MNAAETDNATGEAAESTHGEACNSKTERKSEGIGETPRRYTYVDCLKGAVPVPNTPNGKTLFQILMVGGMVTFMVTINGIRHTGLSFLALSHWLYPLMFCLAFLVRNYIGNALVGFLAPRTALKAREGIPRSVAMTVLNVCCMAPIMCAIATLLINGPQDFFFLYITTLPLVAPIAVLVNYFIVGPVVKLLFNNKIKPAGGLALLDTLRENTDSLTRFLGF